MKTIRLKYKTGKAYYSGQGFFNPTGWYVQVWFLFWWTVAGPFKHRQQAQKHVKSTRGIEIE